MKGVTMSGFGKVIIYVDSLPQIVKAEAEITNFFEQATYDEVIWYGIIEVDTSNKSFHSVTKDLKWQKEDVHVQSEKYKNSKGYVPVQSLLDKIAALENSSAID